MRPSIHIMLKPASGLCNLRCKYCFYADETQKREVASYGRMSLDTLRNVLKKTLEESEKQVTIAFQGGEPTLAGLAFFQQAVELVHQLNHHHCTVSYALQTNGILLDDEWCRFFAQNQFLIGVSLDGSKEFHDRNRVDAEGKGTYSRVMRAIQLLKKHQVDFNILTVLTGEICRNYRKIYGFYDRNGLEFQQYILCLDPIGEKRGGHVWSLTPQRFEEYLKTAFDCWYQDAMRGQKKYHRYFDNLLFLLNGQQPEACGMGGVCGMQYVVEADGSVYPCDFYMLDNWRLGNLNTDDFEQLDRERSRLGFIAQSAVPDPQCRVCRWRFLCRGGCRRDRDYFEEGLLRNYYCSAYQNFFPYALPRLEQVYARMRGC